MKSALLVLLVALGGPASAQVIHVDDSAVGANDGSSWQDAFTDLQAALAVASGGSEIWVARGTYRPSASLDRLATFLVMFGVYGGFDGTEATLADRAGLFDETILSGDLLGDDGPGFAGHAENSAHIATISSFASATLDGFTLRGGNADVGPYHRSGGALEVGGFVFSAFVRNCTFLDNYAMSTGGAIACPGKSPLRIERCTFLGNRARVWGGAVYGGNDTSVSGCRFLGNVAGIRGGGLFLSDLAAVDCVFSGNFAAGEGGGFFSPFGTISNCTFAGNLAALGGGAAGGWAGYPLSAANCVFWGNDDNSGSGPTAQIAGVVVVDHSVVQGWDGSLPGVGTFDADPLFRDPLGPDGIAGTLDDDLGLERDSPCVDTASDASYSGLGVDALGRNRFVDSLGCDGGGRLDRGAIERQVVDGTTEFCDATPSSLGVPARIGGACVVSLSDGPFRVRAQPVPDGRAFLLVGSPAPAQPFGDGSLCLSGSFVRLGPIAPIGGSAVFAVDPGAPPADSFFLPGASIGLQVLFRDPAAGGTGFNLSSAMRCVALP